MNSGLQDGDLVSLTTISDALPGMEVRINSRTSTLRQQEAILEAAGVPAGSPAAQPATNQSEDTAGPDQTSSDEPPSETQKPA